MYNTNLKKKIGGKIMHMCIEKNATNKAFDSYMIH